MNVPNPKEIAIGKTTPVCYYTVIKNQIDVPKDGTIYVLSGKDGFKRATIMTLNGRDLTLGENWELPDLSGDPIAAGKIELAPLTCTFLVV